MGDSVRPSGVVTFLFTDIEGSTRLWQERPDEMRAALEEHDAILRNAIATNGGYVFATGGDSFAAAFQRTGDAAVAAEEAQAGLVEHSFLKVRMGIHTGEAQERDGDYFGPAVNKAARVMSSGHGGQVLLSDTASQIVDVPTVDLGLYVLADLGEPTSIYQLGGGSFPTLRAMTSENTNLRPQLSSFIGREEDVDRVIHLLDDHRLVTLTGVGGVGKTRLAVQAAGEMAVLFPDGSWSVELAPVEAPDDIVAAVASALRIALRPGLSMAESIRATLATRDQLVIFDNCEHLLDATAELIEQLLAETPTLRVIATSREPLDIDGEFVIRLRSLSTSGDGLSPAAELFLDRAQASGADLDQSDLDAVEEICTMLDGIPLAIELAAARCRSMAPADVLARLDQRFRLLRAGRRGRVERHQTLRATVGWSYELLTGDEQAVFDVLSVFVDGASLEAIEAVVTPNVADPFEIPDLIDGLVRKSMIIVDPDGYSRYLLLETLRQFGLEQLAESGEVAVADAQRRHAEYHLAWMSEIIEAYPVPRQEHTAAVIRELGNLRVAVDHLADVGRIGDAAELVRAMFLALGMSAYARDHAGRVVVVAELLPEDDPRRAELLAHAAVPYSVAGLLDRAAELATQSFDMAERYGFAPTAHAYQALSQSYCFRGEVERGVEVLRDGVSRFEPDPTDTGVISMYCCLGGWIPPDESPDSPMSLAVRMAEESGSTAMLSAARLARGGTNFADLDAAREDFEWVELVSTDATALAFSNLGLGRVAVLSGDLSAAAGRYESAVHIAIDSGIVSAVSTCTAALALIAAQLGVREGVAELFGTAQAIERRSGGVLHNHWSDDLVKIEEDLLALGVELDRSGDALSDREIRHLVRQVAEASLTPSGA